MAYLMKSLFSMTRTLFFSLVLFTACATGGGSPANARLDDRDVAMVLRVTNLGEVREGTVARARATSPAVRDFATMMVNEHSNAETKVENDLSKVDLSFTDSDLSRRLDAESGAAAESLSRLSGTAFDRAYIDRQIEAHQAALDTLDRRLIPIARKRQLREQLGEMRKTVQSHLERARQIKTTLK